MCVFRGDFNGTPPQRRSSTHIFTHKHTHTHSHMIGQQWLIGQVVPDIFRVLQNIFLATCGQARNFFRPPGGHAIYENIILRELIVSFYLCLYFYAGIMLQRYSIIRI